MTDPKLEDMARSWADSNQARIEDDKITGWQRDFRSFKAGYSIVRDDIKHLTWVNETQKTVIAELRKELFELKTERGLSTTIIPRIESPID